MNTIEKIRDVLGLPKTKMYAEARLDDGRVVVTEAESMDVGVEVRVLDDSGEASVIDAGTYTLEDGTEIVVNEESRLVSLGKDKEEYEEEEDVDVEVELEHTPDHKEEEEMEEEEEEVEMNVEKVRDALNAGFPDLGEDTIAAIAELVGQIYSNDEESRLVSLGKDKEEYEEEEDVDVEVELEHTPDHKEEEEMEEEEEEVEMNVEKVRDALNAGFPDLGEDTIAAIAELVGQIYSNDEEVVEVEASAETDDKEELASVIGEAIEKIDARLKALEDAPASEGVSHSPNKFSAQHKQEINTEKLTGVERALHIINSHK